MNSLKVSVIVPAYNEEKYIDNALQSVVDQNYDHLELIVVPNGCTDCTAEIASHFTQHVYDTNKKGISNAKNIGFEKSTGDIVVFLDSDSAMQPGLLDLTVDTMNQNYVGGKAKIIPDKKSLGAFLYFSGFVNPGGLMGELPRSVFLPNNGAGAYIFSDRDNLEALEHKDGYVFNPNLAYHEDMEIIDRLRQKGAFAFLTKKGVITSTRRFEKDGYAKRFMMDWVELFKKDLVREDVR